MKGGFINMIVRKTPYAPFKSSFSGNKWNGVNRLLLGKRAVNRVKRRFLRDFRRG